MATVTATPSTQSNSVSAKATAGPATAYAEALSTCGCEPVPAWPTDIILPTPSFNAPSVANGDILTLIGDGPYKTLVCDIPIGDMETITGVTIRNSMPFPVTLTVDGQSEFYLGGVQHSYYVDDDVLFDGEVYMPDAYPFFTWEPVGHQNGAHLFFYTKRLAVGESFLIQGRDNGGGGRLYCALTVSLL